MTVLGLIEGPFMHCSVLSCFRDLVVNNVRPRSIIFYPFFYPCIILILTREGESHQSHSVRVFANLLLTTFSWKKNCFKNVIFFYQKIQISYKLNRHYRNKLTRNCSKNLFVVNLNSNGGTFSFEFAYQTSYGI